MQEPNASRPTIPASWIVAGIAAEEDAAERLMTVLADQIATQIIAASARFAQ